MASEAGYAHSAMGEAVSTPVAPVPGSEIPAGDLDGLCRAVWRRVGREVQLHGQDQPWVWPILQERLHKTRLGLTMLGGAVHSRAQHEELVRQFEEDVQGLLASTAEQFAFCVRANATSPAGHSHNFELARHREVAMISTATLPRVQPMELVLSLKQRDITVTVDTNGNLNVTPANMLGEADRSVLLANKAAIVAALAAPAEVI